MDKKTKIFMNTDLELQNFDKKVILVYKDAGKEEFTNRIEMEAKSIGMVFLNNRPAIAISKVVFENNGITIEEILNILKSRFEFEDENNFESEVEVFIEDFLNKKIFFKEGV